MAGTAHNEKLRKTAEEEGKEKGDISQQPLTSSDNRNSNPPGKISDSILAKFENRQGGSGQSTSPIPGQNVNSLPIKKPPPVPAKPDWITSVNSLPIKKPPPVPAKPDWITSDLTNVSDFQTESSSIRLNVIDVPAVLNSSSTVSNPDSQVPRSGSPAIARGSNATLPEMTADTVLEGKRCTNNSKKEKTKSQKKSAEDVYALQCAVLEKELEKNKLQIEFLQILIKKTKKEEEELPLTSKFSLLP